MGASSLLFKALRESKEILIIRSSHFPFPPQPSVIVSCHQTFIETACVKLINGFLFSKVNSFPVLK